LDGFVSELKELQKRMHKPLYNDWNIMVTTGAQDAFTKAFYTVLDKGDTVLTENPTYSGALEALRPIGVNIVGIPTDHHGIIPEEMEKILQNFSKMYPRHKKPSVLYTIPTGQNPTGSSASNERRKAIYNLSSLYNLLILEDDPYWYLRLLPATNSKDKHEELQSYFSMDNEQRVVRFDSFSKIISSGVRIGWATGPAPFIENMQIHQQYTSLHASGIAQAMVLSLLKHWGPTGFDNHVNKVQHYYSQKRDIFLAYAQKHLTGLCEWNTPVAGMFVWLKVIGETDTEVLIKEKAFKAGVLMLPGRVFSPNDEPSPHVRASFSTATEEQIDTALLRFAELLKSTKK